MSVSRVSSTPSTLDICSKRLNPFEKNVSIKDFTLMDPVFTEKVSNETLKSIRNINLIIVRRKFGS